MFFDSSKMTDEQREELKRKNWAQFCREAGKTKSSCKDCGRPLDDSPTDRIVFERCLVCISLEAIEMASPKTTIYQREARERRQRMGL